MKVISWVQTFLSFDDMQIKIFLVPGTVYLVSICLDAQTDAKSSPYSVIYRPGLFILRMTIF